MATDQSKSALARAMTPLVVYNGGQVGDTLHVLFYFYLLVHCFFLCTLHIPSLAQGSYNYQLWTNSRIKITTVFAGEDGLLV